MERAEKLEKTVNFRIVRKTLFFLELGLKISILVALIKIFRPAQQETQIWNSIKSATHTCSRQHS